MRANPGIKLEIEATNRRVDVIGEGYDLALRVRDVLEDSSLAVRTFGKGELRMVASPALLDSIGRPRTPQALEGMPGVGQRLHDGKFIWTLFDKAGESVHIQYDPKLVCDEFARCARPCWPAWAWPCCRACIAATRSRAATWKSSCPSGICRWASSMRCFRHAKA